MTASSEYFNILQQLWGLIIAAGSFAVSQTINNVIEVIDGISRGGFESLDVLFPLAILTIQFLFLLTTVKTLQMVWYLLHEMRTRRYRAQAYSAHREGGKRILIIGDSTAYGTGAAKPEDTLSGRLARDFPRTEILNTAVNGSLTRDAIAQIDRAAAGSFDLIIISTGGNDIWHFTPLASLKRDLERLLTAAIQRSGHRVILLFYANLAGAPIFPAPLRALLRWRTKSVHEIFSGVSESLNVPLVELYIKKRVHSFDANPFLEEPEKYYASDRMHPNGEGYGLWYNYMWGEMVRRGLVFRE